MKDERVLYDSDYELAAANGIEKRIANERFYRYGWDKQRTITEEVGKPPLWAEYKELALSKGVSYQMFKRWTNRGVKPMDLINLGKIGRDQEKLKAIAMLVAKADKERER